MDYSAALAQLHSLERFGVKPGLERIQELACRLEDPQSRIPLFIHVAGTNGKGSVCSMTDSILRFAGKKTGLFTSPHLHSHRERYRVNGIPVSKDDFSTLFARVAEHIRKMTEQGKGSPTEFEAVTALALLYFAESGVDAAVMEAGMGGRDDSTNIINASISVITDIGLDHMDYLGNTVQEIAANKADIIKKGASAVTSASGAALKVIKAKALSEGAELITVGKDINWHIHSMAPEGSCFDLYTPWGAHKELFLPLAGEHQLANAAAAAAAAFLAGADENAVKHGLAQVKWPARLEIIRKDPLILLDSAHNYPGIRSLIAALNKFWPNKKKRCLLAMLGDKEREKCLDLLLPHISSLVVTRSPYLSRSEDWLYLAERARNADLPAEACEDPSEALKLALEGLQEDEMLLVCGSIYMVAQIRDILSSEENDDI